VSKRKIRRQNETKHGCASLISLYTELDSEFIIKVKKNKNIITNKAPIYVRLHPVLC